MALRGVKPEVVETKLKALFYGDEGVGKTTAAISFPKVYMIDTEETTKRKQYVKILTENGGLVFKTRDYDEILKELTELATTKHDFQTFVIDSLTHVYEDLLEKAERKVGSDFGRHYAEPDKKMKQLCKLLLALDMNVVVTSQAKTKYAKDQTILGTTFDCYKKLGYNFDLVLEIQKRGKEHIAITKKSRIEEIPSNESFVFSYDEIANRYGRNILERDTVPVELATQDQVQQIWKLLIETNTSQDVSQKWLDKSNAQKFDEMPRETIQKCIDHLISKLPQTNTEINA